MKKKILRLHDKLYLKENLYNEPKESFKLLIKLLKKKYTNKNFSLLDVGCASGELLHVLKKNFSKASFSGLDVDQQLINKAKKYCGKNVLFFKKNMGKKNIKVGKYDIIVISGVLSCFEDPKIVLKNLLLNLKPKGEIYIFCSINTIASKMLLQMYINLVTRVLMSDSQ